MPVTQTGSVSYHIVGLRPFDVIECKLSITVTYTYCSDLSRDLGDDNDQSLYSIIPRGYYLHGQKSGGADHVSCVQNTFSCFVDEADARNTGRQVEVMNKGNCKQRGWNGVQVALYNAYL